MGAWQFRDNWYQLAPPWLRTGNGERYMYTLELCRDLLMDKLNQAIKIRFPGQGDPSQLPYLANDRVLVQGPAESNTSFIIRLEQAFNTWGLAGSARAVLSQLQAYMQGLQPGVPATSPLATIVSGSYPTRTNWWTQFQGDAIGAAPSLQRETPANFNWDGKATSWRSWLVLPMVLVATGLSGTGATLSNLTSIGYYYANPGQNVNGVWVPATSGTKIKTFWTLNSSTPAWSSSNVGQWITISGSANPSNNGTFQIVQFISSTAIGIANPSGALDSGPLSWSMGAFPWIAPGPIWGAAGYVFGQGELTTPPVDIGALFQGVWQPTVGLAQGTNTTIAWGLKIGSATISTIRSLVQTWKSGSTYYPNIIITFGSAAYAASYAAGDNAYSPTYSPGSGNPDGTFGNIGKNVNGVWVPGRQIGGQYDAYCQGTGSYSWCSVENVT